MQSDYFAFLSLLELLDTSLEKQGLAAPLLAHNHNAIVALQPFRNDVNVFLYLLGWIDSLDSLKLLVFVLSNLAICYSQGKRVSVSRHTLSKHCLKYSPPRLGVKVGCKSFHKIEFEFLFSG